MLQTLKFNNKKQKKKMFYKDTSLVGLTPGVKNGIYTKTAFSEHCLPFAALVLCWWWCL